MSKVLKTPSKTTVLSERRLVALFKYLQYHIIRDNTFWKRDFRRSAIYSNLVLKISLHGIYSDPGSY